MELLGQGGNWPGKPTVVYTVDGKRVVVAATDGVNSTEEAQELALKKAGWHPNEAKNASLLKSKAAVAKSKRRRGAKPKAE